VTLDPNELISDFAFPEDARPLQDFDRARLFLRNRQVAYQQVFNARTPAGFTVLQDMAWFCRARRSTFDRDPIVAAGLNGQREVWLRIDQHLNLTDEELALLYSKGEGR
jgi:hypothetical protein